MLEMRVFEAGGVFEAEAKEAVEPDVRGPDQDDRKELRFDGRVADDEKNGGGHVSVGQVVESRAEADVGEIAEHKNWW
jgi:hypothetical protein